MNRPARLRTVLLSVLVLLILLAGGLLVGTRLYLHSDRVSRQLATRLQSVLGGKVQVQAADVRLTGGSSIRGIQVYEDTGSGEEQPWIQVEGVEAG